jgi:methyl-accepting chemotaxis protein
MQQISEGNIDIKPAITDDKDEIGPALNKMINAIGSMSNEMKRCCVAALEGNLSNRADATPYYGKYQKIVKGFNNTLDAIMGPVNEASEVLEKIAGKDMTVRMKGEYKGDHAKIKELLNMFVENIDKALQQVAIGAEQVASASVQVSTGGQSLSQGASEQASSLEEVSSSLQEMSSMIKQNTLNAREAKGVAEQARGSADKGVESMNRMSSAINQIKTSSAATAKIVKTIDEIAFQTNLLALNAAVEAARAGDAGRGFAVVAEEVRNLAMRSAEAAKNTANLIEEAVKNSENGVAINVEVLKNFQEITEKTNKVSQVVAEIAAASDQQDQGISQLNKAVEQLNQLTQQNAANAEESASAAEEMSSQSEEMRSMVAGFKLTGYGDLNQALLAGGSQSRHMLHDSGLQRKGGKAISSLQPDPRKVIPLDESDHNVLKRF